MLASVYRTTASKSIKSLACAPTVSAHNFVSRRFNSNESFEEEPQRSSPASDNLMAIISDSINSHTGNPSNEQIRVARGNFRKGDIYKPSDLNDSTPPSYGPPPKRPDELKILNINPINANLLSHYITPLGRLMSREQTGLSAKNQRRVTKAVRRARALCIISPTAKLHQ
ncbi:hypothetical protein BGZ76_001925 [Entomortierella beljakovae]|nr:hypothetical protein BGZ76_001925 [Entomortierella beljakovae]